MPKVPKYLQPFQDHPGMEAPGQASLSQYPGIPLYLPPSWNHPRREVLCQSSLSKVPHVYPHTLCPPISGSSPDGGTGPDLPVRVSRDTLVSPPISGSSGIEVLGQASLSKYPGIPFYLPPSWDHPKMETLGYVSLFLHLPPSQDHPEMEVPPFHVSRDSLVSPPFPGSNQDPKILG